MQGKLKVFVGIIFLFNTFLSGCTRHTYELQGYVEGQFIYLSPAVAGSLFRLLVHKGDLVQPKQTIYSLDPLPEKAQLAQSLSQLKVAQENLENLISGSRETILQGIRAQLKQAEADFRLAKVQLKRNQILYERAAIAKDTLDQQMATYKRAEEKIRELQANLKEAQLGARTH